MSVRLSVTLPDDLSERLRARAAAEDRSVAWLLVRGAEALLEEIDGAPVINPAPSKRRKAR